MSLQYLLEFCHIFRKINVAHINIRLFNFKSVNNLKKQNYRESLFIETLTYSIAHLLFLVNKTKV